MVAMFYWTPFNHAVDHFDVSQVEDFSFLFYGNDQFDQSLTSWNTSSARDLRSMFDKAAIYNHPVDHFDVSRVQGMMKS